MTSREKRFLLIGVALGLAATAVLAFVLSGRGDAAPPAQSAGHAAHPSSGSAPPRDGSAPATLQLTEEEERAIGIRTVPVLARTIEREVLAPGRVEPAETQLYNISAHISGRVDDLLVNFTGQSVRRGQPIARIYSADVMAGAEELRLALDARRQLGPAAHPQAIAQADDLVQASRRRLELWRVGPRQIESITNSDRPQLHVTIFANAGGLVVERKVTEGQHVNEGDVLYTVADLSSVWVVADVYESDLAVVRAGQLAEITTDALPGAVLRGKVSLIEPFANPQTRTIPVRIQVPNPGMRLRPGMFTQVRLRAADSRPVLTIPRSAVLNTGGGTLVYVDTGAQGFESRKVELGAPAGDLYPVVAGLKEGEQVVTEGNFLIDSQTRISGAVSSAFGGAKSFQNGGNATPSAPAATGAEKREPAISFTTDPSPARGAADNTFLVTLSDADGQPVADAQVSVTLVMPAMPAMNMPEMRNTHQLRWDGKQYSGRGAVAMSGGWNVIVEVTRNGERIAIHRARLAAK